MSLSSVRLGVALFTLALGVSACDTTDIPPVSADGRAFTIWGQLDPTTNRQVVRVDQIAATIDATDAFAGSVVSVDLDTGVETVWRDSVVTLRGTQAHLFVADVQPAYGSRVELRVLRDGEVASYARVTIPPRVTPAFGELRSSLRSSIDLVIPGAPRVVGATVIYDVLGDGAGTGGGGADTSFRVDDRDITSVEFGWRVRVDFTSQIELLRRRFAEQDIRNLTATGISVRVAIANEEWAAPFPFTFSRDLLIQPGTVSNVRDGYGFLGAAYTMEVEWEATEDQLRQLGL